MPLKAEGEFALVRKYLQEGLKRLEQINPDELFYSLLVDTAALEEDLDKLEQYAPILAKKAKRIDHKLLQAVAMRAQAVANRLDGKHKQAHDQLEEAEAIFHDLETPWQLGRTYYEFGQLSAAQDNLEDANKYYEQAVHHFEIMAALPDIKRTQAAIDSLS